MADEGTGVLAQRFEERAQLWVALQMAHHHGCGTSPDKEVIACLGFLDAVFERNHHGGGREHLQDAQRLGLNPDILFHLQGRAVDIAQGRLLHQPLSSVAGEAAQDGGQRMEGGECDPLITLMGEHVAQQAL